ncbi:hypothetical protein CCP3SC1_310021 [Gammaproteobacteria bacterium]
MNFISTSLDGVDATTHDTFRGVPGSFDTTCEAVRLLAPHVRLQVIMSLHADNAGQGEALVGLAKALGAASVKFNRHYRKPHPPPPSP